MINMSLTDRHPTCRKILEAAEVLFARDGLAGVSLRQITAAAGVNLAAINYHFYDKASLHRDLILLRLRQVNRLRLESLTAAETVGAGQPVPLRVLLDALARPLFLPPAELGPHAPRLLARLLIEHHPVRDERIRSEFEPMMTRFGQACRRHALRLSPQDYLWRFSHVIGALHHAVLTLPDMTGLTRGICRAEQAEHALDSFIALAENAFAPPAASG